MSTYKVTITDTATNEVVYADIISLENKGSKAEPTAIKARGYSGGKAVMDNKKVQIGLNVTEVTPKASK